MSDYLEFAKKIAEHAGKIAVKKFKQGFEIKYKYEISGYASPVTEADKLCNDFITSAIRKKFPGHGILSEEANEIKGEGEYIWNIDPIDGTRNFSHKIPQFSVSVALVKEGNVICGAVYDPNMDELFSAERNEGAFLNGKRIFVSQTKSMKNAVVSLDGAMAPEVKRAIPMVMSKIIHEVETVRITGGAALGLCYTACGRLDGTINLKCHPHDVAAGGLILLEAGGRIEDFFRKESFPFLTKYVAGNPFVENVLEKIFAREDLNGFNSKFARLQS